IHTFPAVLKRGPGVQREGLDGTSARADACSSSAMPSVPALRTWTGQPPATGALPWSPRQTATDERSESVSQWQRQTLPYRSRVLHQPSLTRRSFRLGRGGFALPAMPVELPWSRAPLELELIGAGIDRRASKIENRAAALHHGRQHFPVKLHVEAEALGLRETCCPGDLGAPVGDDEKARRARSDFTVDDHDLTV